KARNRFLARKREGSESAKGIGKNRWYGCARPLHSCRISCFRSLRAFAPFSRFRSAPSGAFEGGVRGMITFEQALIFDHDDFLLIEDIFSAEEITVLLAAVDEATRVKEHAFELKDREGRDMRRSL